MFLLLALLQLSPVKASAEVQARQRHDATVLETAGKELFERHCAVCHGMEGKGGRGPSLNRPQLTHAPDDAALKSVISDGIPPAMPGSLFLTDDDLASVTAYVRSLGKIPPEPLHGNPVRGASIYAKSGCANCHILAGEGSGYGPDLTGIASRRSPSHIKNVIRKPEANLPEGFLMVEATTSEGEKVEGIRVNEDSFTIQIKDGSGHYYSLRKDSLKDLRKLHNQTPMPGYDAVLTASELDDLVAFILTRGKQ